jgi:Ran GTPase-activating protein (RanGAP) involved in mRNA processing and transport
VSNFIIFISFYFNKLLLTITQLKLKSNNSITHINLTDNCIGDEGASAISEGLRQNSILHTIGLGNNKIGSTGVIALATTLETNNILQRITLENHQMYDSENANKVGVEGVTALAKMLTNNNTLYFLNLTEALVPADENDSQQVVRLLANALETSNTTIIKLETTPIYDPKLERLLGRNMQTHRASQKLKAKLKRLRSHD